MKRVVGLFFSSAVAMVLSFVFFLAAGQAQDDGKLNSESYWSTHNSPIFYGANSITLEQGTLENFDPQDPRFRVFARDFEDGDLTSSITLASVTKKTEDADQSATDVSSSISSITSIPGEYQLTYQVADSHDNLATHTVQVTVSPAQATPADPASEITVVRTVYTLPAMPNLTAAGISRQENDDSQILGISLGASESVKVCAPAGNLDLKLWPANTSYTATSDCLTLASDTFAIPLVTTPILSDAGPQTLQLELAYSSNLSPLNYYHAGDTAATSVSDDPGIAESETIMAPVTATQLADTETLESALTYYQGAIEAFDQLVGLDLNPTELTDQNVRTKTFVTSDFLSLSHTDGLRHLAQYYLSNFENGNLVSRELAPELFIYYVMSSLNDPDRMILADVEDAYNAARRSGTIDTAAKVYALANLLDHFEGAATYAEFARASRVQTDLVASADFFLTTLAKTYGVNVLPYLESWSQGTDWNFQISPAAKSQVMDKQYPLLSSLADFVSAESLANIQSNPKFPLAYDLVSGSVLSAYELTGTVTLSVEIPDFSKLHNKFALIKDGKNIIRQVSLSSLSSDQPSLEISDLPVGTYTLQMPILSDYEQPRIYIIVHERTNTTYSYRYTESPTESTDDLGEEAYNSLKAEIFASLQAYAERVTEQELNDRSRNAAEKSELVRQFSRLRPEDQASYAGLIARIERGGLPTITYTGANAYADSSRIKFYEIIEAIDPEDGVMELDAENTQYRLDRIYSDRLTYYITYQVTDSDGNTVTFKAGPIFISEVNTDDENNELPELPETPELPTFPNEPDENPNDSSNWLGGSNNSISSPGNTNNPSDIPSSNQPSTPSQPSAPTVLTNPSDDNQSNSDTSDSPASPSISGPNDTTNAGLSTGVNAAENNYNPTGSYYVPTSSSAANNISNSISSTDLYPNLLDPTSNANDESTDNSENETDRDVVAGSTATKPDTQTPAKPSSSSSNESDFFSQISEFFGNLFNKIFSDPIMLVSAISAIVAVILLFGAAKKYIELRAEAAYRPEPEINFEDPTF